MSASTPVLLADAVALPHLVRDGENGYLFIPNDSDDLAKKITRILELPAAERAEMGQASRRMVEPHSIEGTLQTFEDLYRGASFEDKVV
jgi:glycosyltransferase involved in cell wall biosynthesis